LGARHAVISYAPASGDVAGHACTGAAQPHDGPRSPDPSLAFWAKTTLRAESVAQSHPRPWIYLDLQGY